MSLIWSGALPHEKNADGKTFLETSPIRNMLCTKISDSTDDWIVKQWMDKTIRNSWIMMGDDEVLQTFWKRLEILSSFHTICSNDILSSIRVVWPNRNKIQSFFQNYLGMISKCFEYDSCYCHDSCRSPLRRSRQTRRGYSFSQGWRFRFVGVKCLEILVIFDKMWMWWQNCWLHYTPFGFCLLHCRHLWIRHRF